MQSHTKHTVTVCALIYTDGRRRIFGVFQPAITRGGAVEISRAHIVARYEQNDGPFPTASQYLKWAKVHATKNCPAFAW